MLLDPFGFQVERKPIKGLAEARTFDISVNVPIMGVNRILDRTRRPDDATLDVPRRVMGRTDECPGEDQVTSTPGRVVFRSEGCCFRMVEGYPGADL